MSKFGRDQNWKVSETVWFGKLQKLIGLKYVMKGKFQELLMLYSVRNGSDCQGLVNVKNCSKCQVWKSLGNTGALLI